MSISLSTFVHGALQVGEMVPGVGILAKVADTALSMTGHQINGSPGAAPPASDSGSPIPALVGGGAAIAAAGVGAAALIHHFRSRKAAPMARRRRRAAAPMTYRRRRKGSKARKGRMPAALARYWRTHKRGRKAA